MSVFVPVAQGNLPLEHRILGVPLGDGHRHGVQQLGLLAGKALQGSAPVVEAAAAIAAGGWIAVAVILVICMAAFLVGSGFGIFFGSPNFEAQSIRQVVAGLEAG